MRRFRRDRAAVGFGVLLALLLIAFLAAPLYASVVADTTPEANHLTDTVTVDGKTVVDQPFTVDSGLLTASFKVKRKEVNKRFADLIEEMYAQKKGEKEAA